MTWDKNTNITEAGKWLKRKIELIERKEIIIANKATSPQEIKRGSIYFCELGHDNIGGEKNKTRPVLVISKNILNKGDTVVVVPLSTKFALNPNGNPKYNNHYLLKREKYTFLTKDSAVKFEDIRSVDIARLDQFIGTVNDYDMEKMKAKLLFLAGY